MNDESLEALLESAGRSAVPPPGDRPELAKVVRRLYARRRRRRAAAGLGVGMVLLGGVLSAVFWPGSAIHNGDATIAELPGPPPGPPSAPQPPSAQDVRQLRAEIAALGAEATRRHRLVRETVRRQRLHDKVYEILTAAEGPDPLEMAHVQLEKTAFLLVDHARRQAVSAGTEAAAEQYRRVVRLFPDTRAAETAREKLRQLPTDKGDP